MPSYAQWRELFERCDDLDWLYRQVDPVVYNHNKRLEDGEAWSSALRDVINAMIRDGYRS